MSSATGVRFAEYGMSPKRRDAGTEASGTRRPKEDGMHDAIRVTALSLADWCVGLSHQRQAIFRMQEGVPAGHTNSHLYCGRTDLHTCTADKPLKVCTNYSVIPVREDLISSRV